jgi:hypothetical protein
MAAVHSGPWLRALITTTTNNNNIQFAELRKIV